MAGTPGAGIGRPGYHISANSALMKNSLVPNSVKKAALNRAWSDKWASMNNLNKDGAITDAYNEAVNEAVNQTPAPTNVTLDYSNKKFTYNIGCVRDAYFSKKASFHQELTPNATGAINDNPSVVTSSNDLWQKSGTNKGMITLFIPNDSGAGIDGVTPTTDSKLQPAENELYGFQFHYNPTTISMVYSGAPNTDVGLEISGQEAFNLVGAQVSQSTISFDIILNRISDQKYYTEAGVLKPEFAKDTSLYSPRIPTADEQKEIFKKGTMYDIDFLLSTVIGYKIDTKYRGRTADVGWLSGRPVTISLGQSLRYLGFINAFSVKHVIFNERMVPTFTTLSLSFNRIPDYAAI